MDYNLYINVNTDIRLILFQQSIMTYYIFETVMRIHYLNLVFELYTQLNLIVFCYIEYDVKLLTDINNINFVVFIR